MEKLIKNMTDIDIVRILYSLKSLNITRLDVMVGDYDLDIIDLELLPADYKKHVDDLDKLLSEGADKGWIK